MASQPLAHHDQEEQEQVEVREEEEGEPAAGILGLLLYAMALQRGSVTVATSAVVVTETLVPAALGVTLLGDRPAHGGAALAGVGFAVTVAGSLLLARYGEAPAAQEARTRSPDAELMCEAG